MKSFSIICFFSFSGLLMNLKGLTAQCSITFSDIQISAFQNQCGRFDIRGGVQFGGGAFGTCGNYTFSGPSDGDVSTRTDQPDFLAIEARVFPNPFSSELFLDKIYQDKALKVKIYNMLGIQVYEQRIMQGSSETKMFLGFLTPGTYLLQVTDAKDYKMQYKQLIIKL